MIRPVVWIVASSFCVAVWMGVYLLAGGPQPW